MYLGYESSLVNKKNQLVFPVRFESQLGKRLLITTWFERSLLILPLEKGSEMLQIILKDTSALLPEARDLERFLYGNAHELKLDTKRRFVIPNDLKTYAQIEKKAVFVGVGDRIELWDEKTYQNYGEMRRIQIRETALHHYNRIIKNK